MLRDSEVNQMYSTKIILPNVDTIKKFVALASKFDFPIILSSKNCVVNGRSIMGIFSLDLSKAIKIEFPENCDEEFKKALVNFQENLND